MARFHTVARVGEIPPGTGRIVFVAGRAVALFNVDGAYHAIDNSCPHQGGPLAEGILTGTAVACPLHFWQFDVTTGRATESPEDAVPRFQVRVQGDEIAIADEPAEAPR